MAVVVSGRGSNLRALHEQSGAQGYTIVGVVSDRPGAAAVEYARGQHLPVHVVDHRVYATRTLFEESLASALDALAPDVIALAGFLRILGSPFVHRYSGRLLNIHPSLLPAFPGLDTHRRALAAGVREHGASVHIVTDALDGGPVVGQARLATEKGESPERLAERVLVLEHQLYPDVLGRLARGELANIRRP